MIPLRQSREAGFSYVEVLVSIVVIALVLGSVIEGLFTGLRGAEIFESRTEDGFHLASLVEETLAAPFSALDAEALSVASSTVPTAYSDAPGSARRRLVYLARYDGDNADGDGNRFTGGDDGLLWIRVQIENTEMALETLTAAGAAYSEVGGLGLAGAGAGP